MWLVSHGATSSSIIIQWPVLYMTAASSVTIRGKYCHMAASSLSSFAARASCCKFNTNSCMRQPLAVVVAFWGECSTLHSLLELLFFLNFKNKTNSTLSCQDQSTVAQRAETIVSEFSLTSCVWVRFLIESHTVPGQRHSQPTPTSFGQGCKRV